MERYRSRHSLTLLVGLPVSTTFLKDNLLISSKAKNVIPPQLNHFTPGYVPERDALTSKGKDILEDVMNSPFDNCEKMGGTSRSPPIGEVIPMHKQ